MSAREFNEWYVLWSIEGFANERIDLIGGIIASTIANSMKAKGAATKPHDFMIDWEKPGSDAQQTQKDMRAKVSSLKAMMQRRKRN